jgi:hypothetical protein
MTEQEINNFEKTQGQLSSLHEEISALAKKSPSDSLNKFKLKFVNKAIAEANHLLGARYKPFDDFDQFDDVEVPSNSDVNLILGQYLNCLEKMRSDNIQQDSNRRWVWVIDNKNTSNIRTAAPKKLESK